MVAQCRGPLGRLTRMRETIEWQRCGRLLGVMMMRCPSLKSLPFELLPCVMTAELLQSVPPLTRTAA